MDDYAGHDSELTAILQYLHHHFVVKYDDVADMLEKFSINEMFHFEALGDILVENGIDPRIYDSKWRYWRGTDVDYQYDVCDILRVNLAGELMAIQNYYKRIQQIPVPKIQRVLESIINDEIGHVVGLTKMLGKYCPSCNYQEIIQQYSNNGGLPKELQLRILSELE